MAKENNEIGDIVKKCKILLLDIEGTTTSISFVKDKLFPYAEDNVKGFLESQWENEDVKAAVAALRKQAAEDQEKSVEGLVAIPGEDAKKEEQIEGLVNNVKWMMSVDRKVGPLKQLQGLIWQLGYDKGDIKGHVYDDVFPALELWRATEGQKVYIYSSGSVQAQKLLFNKSLVGDMLPLIEGHFDTAVGAKQEAASYAAIVEKIGCKAEELLFLTDIVNEAEAARASGLQVALVSREGNAPLPTEATAQFPVLHSFEQLTLTNKRKPEPQVEEVPAKVPKTVQDDVKTTIETEVETTKANGSAPVDAMETAVEPEKPETMDVEETPDTVVEGKGSESTDIIEKDVAMEEVVTEVSAVAEVSVPVETVAKIDSDANVIVDTAINVVKASDNEASAAKEMDKKDEKSSKKDAKVETPQVQEDKAEDAAAKNEDPKVKMVDAATLTDTTGASAKIAVDAATEPVTAEEFTGKSSPKIPIEEPNLAKGPAVEVAEVAVTELTSVEMSLKEVLDTPVIAADEVKDVVDKAPVPAHSVEVSSTADVVGSDKSASIADSTTNETPVAEVKTVEPTTVESQAVDVTVGETFEAGPNEADGTAKDKEALSATAEDSVKPESVQNGVEKAAEKPNEKVVDTVVEKVNDSKDAKDVQAVEAQPIIEEIGEKTVQIETENMETEAIESGEKVETATKPKEPTDVVQEEDDKEAILSTIEVQDITDDKESLSEVTDIIDDVVPIVEEPSQLEEMEELQNAGDVLEKECDEILSKVQDVTNLDYIPVKSLHTIAEEMETENIDSNDIVERILDTEMELSMKPDDIDLNVVQEVAEPKTDSDERIGKIEPGKEKQNEIPKIDDITEEKMEVSCDTEIVAEKANEDKVEPVMDDASAKETAVEPAVEQMETEVAEPKAQVESEKVVVEDIAMPQESKTEAPLVVEPPAETVAPEAKPDIEADKAPVAVESIETTSQEAKIEDAIETKVNGKANGNANIKLNGNASNEEDLKSRLTAETVKGKMNGSNGDSVEAEHGQGDNKVEAEIPDIKVKAVATDEAHTPIEQPVEA